MVDVIITGYTFDPEGIAEILKKLLEEKGREVRVIDPFEKERKNLIFRHTLLTRKTHLSFVKTIEKKLEGTDIDTMYTFSYGVIGILSQFKAKKYVLIAPPIGTSIFKRIERIFGFLPGLTEVRNGSLANKLFTQLFMTEMEKIIVLSSEGDGRVEYSQTILDELQHVSSIQDFGNIPHKAFMQEISNTKKIVEF
ncbi:MAG: hypothetical protein PHG24_01280 [Candidatus Pacebacteria bacterium]|nr:hypothetical protein [Candidatus Paceibacterota bacterium]